MRPLRPVPDEGGCQGFQSSAARRRKYSSSVTSTPTDQGSATSVDSGAWTTLQENFRLLRFPRGPSWTTRTKSEGTTPLTSEARHDGANAQRYRGGRAFAAAALAAEFHGCFRSNEACSAPYSMKGRISQVQPLGVSPRGGGKSPEWASAYICMASAIWDL